MFGANGVRYDDICGKCGRDRDVDNSTNLCRPCTYGATSIGVSVPVASFVERKADKIAARAAADARYEAMQAATPLAERIAELEAMIPKVVTSRANELRAQVAALRAQMGA